MSSKSGTVGGMTLVVICRTGVATAVGSRTTHRSCGSSGVLTVACRSFHCRGPGRAGYEADLKVIFDIEEIDEDRPFMALRQLLNVACELPGSNTGSESRGELPKPITIGDSVMEITPELWDRWKSEQGRLVGGVYDLIGRDAIQFGVKWPTESNR